MTTDLLGGAPEATGTMTTGGTESILRAVKTARDHARSVNPDLRAPEMIVPLSIYPAFQKAAHYLEVKVVSIPVGEDFRADVEAARNAITEQTILMVGSAPSFPQGVVDPIEQMAAIFVDLGRDGETEGARQKIARWYWCGVLGELYGRAIESRFARDLPEVAAWARWRATCARDLCGASSRTRPTGTPASSGWGRSLRIGR